MRTIIRMQRKGVRNNKYFWIVLQSKWKNVRGRYIDKLGMWYPKNNVFQKRSIVTNKPFIRKWIARGSKVNNKPQHLFSLASMMPSPWIKFGRSSLYQKETEKEIDRKYLNQIRLNKAILSKYETYDYDQIREKEEMNLFKRRIKGEQFLNYYLNYMDFKNQSREKNIEVINELIESDSEGSVIYRSCKFYMLTKAYESIENEKILGTDNLNLLNDAKKEVIIDKLNKLSNENIINFEDLNKYIKKFDNKFLTDGNSDKAMKLKYIKDEQFKQKAYELMDDWKKPVTRQEFKEYVIENSSKEDEELLQNVDEFFDAKENNNDYVTKQEMKDYVLEYNIDDRIEKTFLRKEHFHKSEIPTIIPTDFPITPFPDLDSYNPEEYYDLRESVGKKISPYKKKNRWFEMPNDFTPKYKEDYGKKTYKPKREDDIQDEIF